MLYTQEDGVLTIELEGRIDTTNAEFIKADIDKVIERTQPLAVVLNANYLTYISSAGLRVVIGLLKRMDGKVSFVEVTPKVYEVLDMTGLPQMMEVRKRLREVSLEGAKFLSQGGNGEVWRLDPETVIKVYNEGASLDKIRQESEVAQAAFTSGLPCAIPFGTVRVGERYGIVFELLNAETVGRAISNDPTRLNELGQAMGELLHEMHHTVPSSQGMPRMTDKANAWIDYLGERFLDESDVALMRSIVEAIPEADTLLHLDFHEGNVMIQNDELVLIDLDDMCVGNPVYDLIAHWVGHTLAAQNSPDALDKSFGMSADLIQAVYEPTICAYFGTEDPQVIERHSEAMQLFSLFFIVLYLAKGKDSSNLTPARVQGVLQQILPQLRQYAPEIVQMAASCHF